MTPWPKKVHVSLSLLTLVTVATEQLWMPGSGKLGCALPLKGRGQRATSTHWTVLSGRSQRNLASWTPGRSKHKVEFDLGLGNKPILIRI